MDRYEEAANVFQGSFKGLGADQEKIIFEILKYTNYERQIIKEKYLTFYGKALDEVIRSKLNGNLQKTVLALMIPIEEFEARCLRDALKGVGTNERVLIEILCPKQAYEILNIKNKYNTIFDRDLEEDIKQEVSGNFGCVLKSLISAGRSENLSVDNELAKKEANELYQAGENKFGTDNAVFIRILCSHSFPQLNAIFNEYDLISKKGIERAIKSEMSGSFEKICLAIVKCVRDKAAFYAEALHDSMSGVGTNDASLIRLLVSRAEIDLHLIKNVYQTTYYKSLYYDIDKDTSGDYKKLLLEIVKP